MTKNLLAAANTMTLSLWPFLGLAAIVALAPTASAEDEVLSVGICAGDLETDLGLDEGCGGGICAVNVTSSCNSGICVVNALDSSCEGGLCVVNADHSTCEGGALCGANIIHSTCSSGCISVVNGPDAYC